jgi:prepilin-type N-terminal cleavage/methylation domain-containing protein
MIVRGQAEQDGRDQGVSLVELVVAMLVSGVVAVMVATVTLQAVRIQRDTTNRETDSTAATLVMQQLSRDVRQALAPQTDDAATQPAFVTATAQQMTLVTWVGSDPVRVTWRQNGTVLTRSVQQPVSTGEGAQSTFANNGPQTTATVSRAVTSPTLFSYVDTDLNTFASVTTVDDLNGIRAVSINLTVDSDGSTRLSGTTLNNTVTCLNL